jgi:hypothetical protein
MRFTLTSEQLLAYLKQKAQEWELLRRKWNNEEINWLTYDIQAGIILDDMLRAIEDSETVQT